MEIKTQNDLGNKLNESLNESLVDEADCKARTMSVMSTDDKGQYFLGNSIHEKYPNKYGRIKVLFYITENVFVTVGPDCKFTLNKRSFISHTSSLIY